MRMLLLLLILVGVGCSSAPKQAVGIPSVNKTESLQSYLDRKIKQTCEGGKNLSIEGLAKMLKANTSKTCRVYRKGQFENMDRAGLKANDNYSAGVLIVNLVNLDENFLSSDNLIFRDVNLCKSVQGGVTTVAYDLKNASDYDHRSTWNVIEGSKVHFRKAVMQFDEAKLSWVGQLATKVERKVLGKGLVTAKAFSCGVPEVL